MTHSNAMQLSAEKQAASSGLGTPLLQWHHPFASGPQLLLEQGRHRPVAAPMPKVASMRTKMRMAHNESTAGGIV